MRMGVLELTKLGYTRVAALADVETHERAKRAWEGAFLAHHPSPGRAHGLWRLHREGEKTDFGGWLRKTEADALIVSTTALLALPGLRRAVRERALTVVTLSWKNEAPGIGGVDKCHERVAAHAVDLVIAQLHLNELGPPDFPRMMLFAGSWVPPAVTNPVSAVEPLAVDTERKPIYLQSVSAENSVG